MEPRFEFDQTPVLVVGGDGFIGANCVRALHGRGARVTLLARRALTAPPPPGVEVVIADLRDFTRLLEVVSRHRVVFDCAGGSGAVQSNTDMFHNLDVECQPHLHLFDACSRQANPPLVIFLSSRLVYGKPSTLPVDEHHALAPESVYAVHKITLEHYLRILQRTRGLPYCNLRVSNPYGPHRGAGQKSYGVINQFIDAAARGQAVRIFGDGSQQRDYIHIDDLIVVMLATAANPACYGHTFNVGTGVGVSIRDAILAIGRVLQRDIPIEHVAWPVAAQLVETGDYVTDVTKLRAAVSLPPFASFADGVARTVVQQRAQLGVK